MLKNLKPILAACGILALLIACANPLQYSAPNAVTADRAVSLDGLSATWYLSQDTSTGSLILTQTKGSITGWQPTLALGTTAQSWTSPAISGNIAGGTWSLSLWTSGPGTATLVKAEILKGSTVLGSAQVDVNATGGGNHSSVFSIAVAETTFTNENLAIRLTKLSGGNVIAAFNTNDFNSTLTTGAVSAPTPTPSPSPIASATPGAPIAWHLLQSDANALVLSVIKGSATGWNPTIALNSAVQTWGSVLSTQSFAAGTWTVAIWSSNPGSASLVKAELVKISASGAVTSLGSSQVDVSTSGGGNHVSTFSIALAVLALNNEKLGLNLSLVSGSSPTVAFNSNDFDSLLTSTATLTTTPNPSVTPSVSPSLAPSVSPSVAPSVSPSVAPTTDTVWAITRIDNVQVLTQNNTNHNTGWENVTLAQNVPQNFPSAVMTKTIAGGYWAVALQIGDGSSPATLKAEILNGTTVVATGTTVSPGSNTQLTVKIPLSNVPTVNLNNSALTVRVTQTAGPSVQLGYANGYFNSYLDTAYSVFNIKFANFTNGVYPDSQIFISIIGNDNSGTANQGRGVYLDPTLVNFDPVTVQPYIYLSDHIGQNIPSISLAALKAKSPNGLVNMPGIFAGRLYISLGRALTIPINGANGYAGPVNSGVNKDILFDFMEFTNAPNGGTIFTNVTQVDSFCFPIALQCLNTNNSYMNPNGTLNTVGAFLDRGQAFSTTAALAPNPGIRDRIFADFLATVAVSHPDFAGCVVKKTDGTNLRIVAPSQVAENLVNKPAGVTVFGDVSNADNNRGYYFDGYINAVWNYLSYTGANRMTIDGNSAIQGMAYDRPGTSGSDVINTDGTVLVNGSILKDSNAKNILWPFVTIKNGHKYYVAKPYTLDIFMGANTLTTFSTAQTNDTDRGFELHMGDVLCSDFNRHVMPTASQQYNDLNPAQYYSSDPANYYAQFWHPHSPLGLAYGYSYDDYNDQSSTIALGNPKQLTVAIYW